MDDTVSQFARHLLDHGLAGLSQREGRVIRHIAGRSHVVQDVNAVIAEKQTFGEHLADRVAQLGGSWAFIVIFSGLLGIWVLVNTVVLAKFGGGFDPYPFIFLNLILSMVAALQAPVILMSQNRQALRDRLAASLDYEVNLKAEIEITSLHEKLDRIDLDRLEVLAHEQARQIQELKTMVLSGRNAPSAE